MAFDRYKFLYKQVNKTNPKKEDVVALREFLIHHPAIIQDILYLPNLVIEEFLELLFPKESKRLLIKAQLEDLKMQYGYEYLSIIERMLVDNILLCWLRLNYLEGCLNHYYLKGSEYSDFETWDKLVSSTQRRFTRAIDSLGRLKKFNINFQVNIAADGGQQVNIQENK